MRLLLGFLAALAVLSLPASAQAPRRVALVIGNAIYENAGRLANPPNDARAVAAALSRAGFQTVETANDLTLSAFTRALRDFRDKANGAQVALVYYAGHGVEGAGKNWLIPTDAVLASERDLTYEAVALDLVMETVTGASLRVVILDACRDNPLSRSWTRGTRSAVRGLAGEEYDDVLVIYAAAPGQTARDGGAGSDNSPFAASLARWLPERGLPIQLLGGRVRDDVLRSTDGVQRPFVSASITGEPFYLNPADSTQATTVDAETLEALTWQGALGANSVEAYRDYLRRYPEGRFKVLAEQNIARIGAAPQPAADARAARQDGQIDVWFAGSPYDPGRQPQALIPPSLMQAARGLGYTVRGRGFTASAFQTELAAAVARGEGPDVIFVDNFYHVEGGGTGGFTLTGMVNMPDVKRQMVTVNESLSDLGRGWEYLLSNSPDHAPARALVETLGGCDQRAAVDAALLRQAQAAISEHLACTAPTTTLANGAMPRTCAYRPATPVRVTACRATTIGRTAWVESVATLASETEIGERSFVTVHDLTPPGPRVITVSGDELSTGDTTTSWRVLAARPAARPGPVSPPILETPDGVYPAPATGQRFGAFAWRPAPANAIAQLVEFQLGTDVRLFVVHTGTNAISTGQLMSGPGVFRWRVSNIGADGALTPSETRTFRDPRYR